MTDYTKLTERLRTDAIFDNTTLGNEAADAIEALQKEVSALDVLLEECKMDWSGDVTQLKAEHKHEIEALQSKLDDAIQSSAHWQHQFTELQAENERLAHANNALKLAVSGLQSQLGAMGKGEPVANLYWHWYNDEKGSFNTDLMSPPFGGMADDQEVPVYAAPKAMAPQFTECRIELVGAIHTLASHYENRLGRLDPEDRKLAEGDIAHAMATAAKWNWNGNGIGGTP